MSADYGKDSWEGRWAQALEQHGDGLAQRPPNGYLTEVVDGLAPGDALDAGCGHGAESLWLAARGWHVTAVDFAEAALDFGRSTAAALELTDRVDWLQADLGTWIPPSTYQLVLCLYVHIAGSRDEFVKRMAAAVAPGGSLLMVGHQGIDQAQASVADVARALDLRGWEFVVAEDRPRSAGGVDAVVHVRRR